MGANKMWNYRIIQTKPEEYGLYEVIYNEDGDISAYTENPEVIAESPEDLLLSLRLMLDDAQKSYNNILKSDEIELNTAEQNVVRRNEVETDVEIETLNAQLETIKNNQKDANFKFQRGEQDSELKTATEELDELNTKKKELDEAVADFINCRNGR